MYHSVLILFVKDCQHIDLGRKYCTGAEMIIADCKAVCLNKLVNMGTASNIVMTSPVAAAGTLHK